MDGIAGLQRRDEWPEVRQYFNADFADGHPACSLAIAKITGEAVEAGGKIKTVVGAVTSPGTFVDDACIHRKNDLLPAAVGCRQGHAVLQDFAVLVSEAQIQE